MRRFFLKVRRLETEINWELSIDIHYFYDWKKMGFFGSFLDNCVSSLELVDIPYYYSFIIL